MLRLQFNPFPQVNTARLHLRNVTPADANEMFFLRSDTEVQRFVDRPKAVSVEDAVRYIDDMNNLVAKNEVILWGISLVPHDKMIGYICLFHIDRANARCEVGYLLHTEYHRKGIMREALSAVVEYGFQTIGLHTIVADVNPRNIASIGLLRSLGFVQEAYFRESCFFNGKFLDSAIYTKINRV